MFALTCPAYHNSQIFPKVFAGRIKHMNGSPVIAAKVFLVCPLITAWFGQSSSTAEITTNLRMNLACGNLKDTRWVIVAMRTTPELVGRGR